MNVTQPCSTGLGGDAFCLFYDAKTKKVHGLNGSGRAAAGLTLSKANADGFNDQNLFPQQHGHAVTVPGAAAAWCDSVAKFGSGQLSMKEILQPAIKLATNGFPVSQITSFFWDKGSHLLKSANNRHGSDMLIGHRAPKWGEVFRNQNLARVFQVLAEKGKEGFYKGEIAESIVEVVQQFGGTMTVDDLSGHETTYEDPISVDYKGVRLWETAPNGQGIVALMALNILKEFDLKGMQHNSTKYLHVLIEAIRLSFADALAYLADPTKTKVPIEEMLSERYAKHRRQLIDMDKSTDVVPGTPWGYTCGNDTIYLTVVDGEGNACSFINSNYMGFGSGIVPKNCGFTLQNRGANFSLKEEHPNVVAPGKRPFHTIIPAMLTDSNTGELLASYGVMGGFMQPQGHVQVLLNMLEFGMDPQRALDMPRFCVGSGHLSAVGQVLLEDGVPQEVFEELMARGHEIDGPIRGHNRAIFGRGHVITRGSWWRNEERKDRIGEGEDVLWAGSDPRADGYPMGY
ncbi:hypothetical protein CAPTEDRAFT_163281 [Capitella teleta]|uniref:Gamma-glutamyltransferase n=1 Tax=Capitella teleta TaxID=283909 RepID=R7UQ78_CAPTE|nr:hypothetical protein CAPTEDRAFT_163281 [Capitella teleta]|eukprot:ELU08360.1 hypothetical protein CAPTEDRAFT_163281 [Capitella teleta]